MAVDGGEVPFAGPNAGAIPDDIMEQGLRELMFGKEGEEINFRAPTEQEAHGYSSQDVTGPPEPEGPTLEELANLDTQTRQVMPQGTPTDQDWRTLYGRSENEKGELRAQLRKQEELLNQLLAQQQAAAYQTPQMPPPQNYQQQQQFSPPPDVRLFRGKDKGDFVSVEEAENALLPPLFTAYQQIEAMKQRIEAQEQQTVAARKAAVGITPLVEYQLLNENPWLRGTTGPAQVDAMVTLMRAKQAATPQAPQTPPQPARPAPVQTAVRRVTYVEGSRPAQSEARPANPEQAFFDAWQATYQLPLSEREKAQRDLLLRAGVQQHSGYRDPNILTR